MESLITLRTELFNYRDVKPHFINPCCFGEDLSAWLKLKVVALEESGFKLSEILQEDYGWGFWARRGGDSFWIATARIGNRTEDYDGEWGISMGYDPGLDLIKRIFHK